MGITGCDRIVAFTRVVSAVPGDTANLFVRRDLIKQGNNMGASPMLLVTSTARISSVFSLIPM